MPNFQTVMYDSARAQSAIERAKQLEILLHAILQRHHPNGCEVSRVMLDSFQGPNEGSRLMSTENLQRGSMIIASIPGRNSRA